MCYRTGQFYLLLTEYIIPYFNDSMSDSRSGFNAPPFRLISYWKRLRLYKLLPYEVSKHSL